MTLITIISDPAERTNGEAFLAQLINLGRMPRHTQAIVEVGSLQEYLPQAPPADLHIFGLQQQLDLPFIEKMVAATNASCIFVQGSGHESALA